MHYHKRTSGINKFLACSGSQPWMGLDGTPATHAPDAVIAGGPRRGRHQLVGRIASGTHCSIHCSMASQPVALEGYAPTLGKQKCPRFLGGATEGPAGRRRERGAPSHVIDRGPWAEVSGHKSPERHDQDVNVLGAWSEQHPVPIFTRR